MGAAVYVADPAVASHYHGRIGEWVYVPDDAEAAWLIAQRHAWSINARAPVPAPGYVHRGAPAPFVPYVPPAPKAATRR